MWQALSAVDLALWDLRGMAADLPAHRILDGSEATDWAHADEPVRAWLFAAPHGGPLSESDHKRPAGWKEATRAIGVSSLRVHDLRHTAASVWLGAGADPKVVQRMLGHSSAR